MTAPASLADLMGIRMVALPDTPAAVTKYNNLIVAVRSSDLALMGSGDQNPGYLLGVFGWTRPNGGAATQNGMSIVAEWVMAPPIPTGVVTAFEAIPGQQGWLVPAARTVFATAGQQLILDHGIPANVVLGMLQALYPAAIAEGVERFSRGLPLP